MMPPDLALHLPGGFRVEGLGTGCWAGLTIHRPPQMGIAL
jgi:hypothetical protein